MSGRKKIYIQFDPARVIQKHIEVNLHGLAVFNGNYDKENNQLQQTGMLFPPSIEITARCQEIVTLWPVHTSKSISITNSLYSENHAQSGNCKLIISISFRVIVVLSSDFLLGLVPSLHSLTHFAPENKQTKINKVKLLVIIQLFFCLFVSPINKQH